MAAVGGTILFLEGMGLIGATGYGAPIAIVGTVLYLGFQGIKWLVTDSEEVELMKKYDVYEK